MKAPTKLSRLIGSALLLVATACASLPSEYPPPPDTVALAPDPGTALGRHVADFAARHGSDVSGYSPLDANGEALEWRLALVDSAERSLDLLYYLWYNDPSGLVLLEHVIEAAERGVRVRAVVDDALFLKGKSSLANLSAHQNIEVRVFNPWASKGATRAFETVARAKKLNRRMHDKLLIADNQAAILGGRNIGDHYFGLHHK
ncbi:MAG: phospholipase D-like domain-containing protein, partial [Thermoanaerobaculales bacterium]|nr:phospholipase D-like domain-containing protein [Thermoanaerobaculales bacterium]